MDSRPNVTLNFEVTPCNLSLRSRGFVTRKTLRLSVTLTSAVPVYLFVYNPDEKECGREGGYIAGANFLDQREQPADIPASVGRGKLPFYVAREKGNCTLSIKAHQGETAVLSEEIRTDVSVSFRDGGLSIEAGTPRRR